jgi:hypothetical protein
LVDVEQRLFSSPPTAQRLAELDRNPELADQVEAFASRFGRLQDLIGDKIFVRLARLLEEEAGSRLEMLDRAERLGWIASSERWLASRKLRNSLAHDYFESAEEFLEALLAVRSFVAELRDALARVRAKALAIGLATGPIPEIAPVVREDS